MNFANDIIYYKPKKRKESSRGEKRKGKGIVYGKRKGESLVGNYGRGIEGGLLFGIAKRHLRGVASVSMGFAAFAN